MAIARPLPSKWPLSLYCVGNAAHRKGSLPGEKIEACKLLNLACLGPSRTCYPPSVHRRQIGSRSGRDRDAWTCFSKKSFEASPRIFCTIRGPSTDKMKGFRKISSQKGHWNLAQTQEDKFLGTTSQAPSVALVEPRVRGLMDLVPPFPRVLQTPIMPCLAQQSHQRECIVMLLSCQVPPHHDEDRA